MAANLREEQTKIGDKNLEAARVRPKGKRITFTNNIEEQQNKREKSKITNKSHKQTIENTKKTREKTEKPQWKGKVSASRRLQASQRPQRCLPPKLRKASNEGLWVLPNY